MAGLVQQQPRAGAQAAEPSPVVWVQRLVPAHPEWSEVAALGLPAGNASAQQHYLNVQWSRLPDQSAKALLAHATRGPRQAGQFPAPLTDDAAFTTIGRWDSGGRDVELDGQLYTWRKRTEWQKLMELPSRTGARFDIAMDVHDAADRERLAAHGWKVRDPIALSADPDAYRAFIRGSAGEVTTAKDVNVRLRSGWFSDRSACYLAAGRPVVVQDTAFDDVLPTGEGLFSFRTLDEAVASVAAKLKPQTLSVTRKRP